MGKKGRPPVAGARWKKTTVAERSGPPDMGTPEVQARTLSPAIQLVAKHPLWRQEMAQAAREIEMVANTVYGHLGAHAARLEPSYGGTADISDKIDQLHTEIFLPWSNKLCEVYGQQGYDQVLNLIIDEKLSDFIDVQRVLAFLAVWVEMKSSWHEV